ncbi:programmed cell death 6-interacting protein [Trichonephila clavata]|uniref:Programmed cell death 6-interacting protein n=1 Tax=Trichonephila clavata TaxID=2740835 RepID=A0A8X6HLG4_TRICU|nr:programmed cell death 6-interacting protein [Trichonephila clavata]
MESYAKFLSALSSEGNVNEQALSVETLGEVYGPLQKRIQDNISRQEQLVHDIQLANNEFSKEKNNSSSASRREALLCELAAAHDDYMELLGNLQEGSKFYNNLTEILVNFQNKINDFCFARKTEKEEVVKDLQKDIVAATNQPTPLAPPHHNANQKPARPPPPKVGDNATAPPPHNWSYPPASTDSQQMPQQQTAYPPYPAYPYPYPPVPNAYNPYGQIMMPPFPPAPGYQGQPTYGGYPYPQQQQQQQPPTGAYPYPQQQYRPWQP